MCSAYNRKPLRGGAAAAATSSEVWSSSRSIKWDARAQANIWSISGSSCGQLFRREIRANHQPPRKTRSFRSGSSVSAGNVAMKAKNHEKMFRNTQSRSVERGLNLFSPRVGTLVSSVTHYLKTSRRRGPRAGGRLRRSRNYCCADGLTGSGRQ